MSPLELETIDDSLDDGGRSEGCCCLKELTENDLDNFIVLRDLREVFAESRNDDDGYRVRGTDGEWVAGTPVAATVFIRLEFEYFETHDGKKIRIPYFVVLAHELCGHLLYFNRGMHRKDRQDDGSKDIPNGEVDAVDEENKIRKEHELPERTRY